MFNGIKFSGKISKLHSQGLSNRTVGKRLKMADKTVAKYLDITVSRPTA